MPHSNFCLSTSSGLALRHHQQVVIGIRDACHVAERLTQALSEGVNRRAEGVICIQSEGRIAIVAFGC